MWLLIHHKLLKELSGLHVHTFVLLKSKDFRKIKTPLPLLSHPSSLKPSF
jgi:hypothetical protein